MAEPFKNLLNAEVVACMGQHLAAHAPRGGFNRRRFEQLASTGLEALEMKARAMHIADALVAALPAEFSTAASTIEAALAPPVAVEGVAQHGCTAAGMAGWAGWPLGEFVVRNGMATPERALRCLHALTQRFTAEWALRPFIEHHPALAWPTLHAWAQDSSEHVRRLASEGSRPRLPWGLQLKGLIRDPSPTLPLLRTLQDDPSAYVRRSVANHLNDIGKDHPGLVAQWLQQHLPGASPERRSLLRHASRSLIKAGDAAVLKAWGLGRAFKGSVAMQLSPPTVVLGGAVALSVQLLSQARTAQALVVDFAVHYVKANGSLAPNVHKGWNLSLAAGEQRALTKVHALKPVTTRRHHSGRHAVVLLINGQPLAHAHFDLVVPA